ncbi:tripartite motif-containing protein 2-like isoform X1 [Watersipora subatra]|uniref:tripartite motif-containing protein 2-like isoform X1 n=1 Tax=Watersipora subatra TaxID=2589382 RepID=UPI00355BBA6F
MDRKILTAVAEAPTEFQDEKPGPSPHGSPNSESSCETCLERLPYMRDPRKLPCSHVFCYSCLQEEFSKLSVVNCKTCGKCYDKLELDRVTKVERMKTSENEKPPAQRKPELCDVCKGSSIEPAVTFCIDCSKRLCQQHNEFHDNYQKDFSSKEHKKITIDQYMVEPNKFEMCERAGHTNKPLIKGCSNCYRLFCEKCDVKINCDFIGAKLHVVCEIEDIAAECRRQLGVRVKNASNRITDIVNLQTQTSGDLSEIQESVAHMSEEVDRVVEEQIEAIRLKGSQLKDEIEVHLHQSTSQADMFSNSLMAKKDLLGQLWGNAQRLITQCRDAEVVRQYNDKREELDKALEIELGFCHLSRRMLSRTGFCRELELELETSSPSALKYFVREKNSTIHCSTACWTEDANFLCGRESLLEIRHNNSTNVLKSLKTSNANGVARHKQGYVALHWSNGKNYIILYSFELAFQKLFGEFFRTTDKFSHIASSNTNVVAVDPDHKLLKVYNLNGDSLYDMKLVGMMRPWGVHCLPDGCVLVSDFLASNIKKFKLRSGSSEPIWVCRDLESPVGISTDFSGLIYVSSFSGKKIYILSNDGLKMKVLTHKKLQNIKEVYDIDIADQQIVLACGEDGILGFQLTYDAVVM